MRIIYLLVITGILSINPLIASELNKPLVDTDWLSNNLQSVSIIDIRSNKKSFTSEPTYEIDKKSGKKKLVRVGGHIPGAQLVLYKNVRGSQSVDGLTIKYMLPSKAVFEQLMQKAGVNQNNNIVIVTNAESEFDLTMASRMYWQLKYYGHDNLSILNGGTAQWIIDGYKIKTKEEKSSKGNWVAHKERTELLAGSEEVYSAIDNNAIQIVDVRPLGQYLGTYKSSKVKYKGHIPSAKLFPINLAANRSMPVKFSLPDEISKVVNALGIKTTGTSIAYCNSGHMASGGWFVLYEILGNKNAKLYDGSMHQWTTEKRPVISMEIE